MRRAPATTALRGATRGAWLALALVLAWPAAAPAQVFLASHEHPRIAIGPLFVSTSIDPSIVEGEIRPAMVTISWSLVVRPPRPGAEARGSGEAQDLFLLWPGEAVVEPGAGRGDPALRAYLEHRGFRVLGESRTPLTARGRAQLGTPAPPTPLGVEAPFATFVRAGAVGHADVGTLVKIPWTPRMADSQSLVRLSLRLHDVVSVHPATWLENAFWSRRYLATLSFGDVGRLSLYPLYFEHRDRVVPLARDFSLLLINFSQASHLKVDQIVPVTAARRPSQSQEGTELVSMNLSAAEGVSPQVLRVQFSYFRGRVPWQPVIFSALFLVLGNITGPIVAVLVRRALRVVRARVHVGRVERDTQRRARGVFLSRDQLDRLVPGETTRADVLRICGSAAEEHERLAASGKRTLVYKGRRLVPHRRLSLGWFAAVDRWEVEQQDVEIEFADDRVADVQARVRRYRLAEPDHTE